MTNKKQFIIEIFILIILVLCGMNVNADSNILKEIELWREHIVTKGNLGGVEFNDNYKNLEQMGPNILPDLLMAYEKEHNPHVLYYYEGLLRRVGHFEFFEYSKEQIMFMGRNYQVQDVNDIPFLSMEVGHKRQPVLPMFERINFQRDKLVQWWAQRDTFARRTNALEKIRTISGRSNEPFLAFTNTQERQFYKLKVYGIYNIPYYIDLIKEDNNPVVFVEFLRITNHSEYNKRFQMMYNLAEFSRTADHAYPDKKAKMDIICQWWTNTKQTYTNLPELYAEIERRIIQYCTEQSLGDGEPGGNY